MLGSYRDLFATPGVRQPWLANAAWRVQGTMASLALLLYVQHQANLQLAGFSAGALAITIGATAVAKAALVDRYGIPRVLAPQAVLLAAGYALVLIGGRTLPDVLLPAGAVLIGLGWNSVSSNMRLLWMRVFRDDEDRRARSAALESALGPVAASVGPLIVALCVALSGPAAALVVSACFGVGAAALFACAPLVRELDGRVEVKEGERRKLTPPGSAVRISTITCLASASCGGMLAVALAAVTQAHRESSLTGVLFAVLAISSAGSALHVGGRFVRAYWTRMIPILMAALAVGMTLTWAAAGMLIALVPCMVWLGAAQGPLGASALYGLSETTPHDRLNIALSWNITISSAASSAGSAAAGVIAAHYGTGWLFAAAVGVLGYGTMRAATARLDPRA